MDKSATLKAVLIVVLFFITFGATLIPFILRRCALTEDGNPRRRRRYMLIFSFLSCYGGGIFVGTCLMDLLPDAKEKLAAGVENMGITMAKGYPLTEFMVCAGFLLILISEQTGVWYKERKTKYKRLYDERRERTAKQKNDDSGPSGQNGSEDHSKKRYNEAYENPTSHDCSNYSDRIRSNAITSNSGDNPDDKESGVTDRDREFHFHSTEGQLDGMVNQPYQTQTTPHCGRKNEPGRTLGSLDENDDTIPIIDPEDHMVESPGVISGLSHRSISAPGSHKQEDHQPGEEMIHVHFDPEGHSSLRAILLVTALSLHSLFEGMALGLQSDATNTVTIFVALVIHKSIVAFSLGLRLVQSPLNNAVIVGCDLIFVMMAVFGGIVGIVVTEELTKGPGELANGMLQGIACGTFLYITFFEILPHELNPPGFRMAKLIVLVLGFITVSVLMFFK